ncbi:hypothetical protein DTO169E5_3871 [Paecilomyces variotii]|nr:hypothetical protein DTO169E5_3871 [Paecilomyces variotii]KAJ9366342.1 hypothetical protein DTO282E5_8983 [Paecilomyces variotii]KAJ9399291.1 hypothetical protein DTO282F9_3914 [Paecilomyces variotii]
MEKGSCNGRGSPEPSDRDSTGGPGRTRWNRPLRTLLAPESMGRSLSAVRRSAGAPENGPQYLLVFIVRDVLRISTC